MHNNHVYVHVYIIISLFNFVMIVSVVIFDEFQTEKKY